MVKFFFSDMSFSKWLKTKRKEAKMSQEVLAAKVSSLGWQTTGANISNIEREYDKTQEGKPTQPKETLVETIAIALNRPIDEARVKANYAPKSKEALEILETVNFSIFNNEGIETIKSVISSLPMIRPELLKTEQQTRAEILDNLGIAKPNVKQLPAPINDAKVIGKAKHPELAEASKIRQLPGEIASENAVNQRKNLLTENENQSIITKSNNDISPSPKPTKIAKIEANYAHKQEPVEQVDEEAA